MFGKLLRQFVSGENGNGKKREIQTDDNGRRHVDIKNVIRSEKIRIKRFEELKRDGKYKSPVSKKTRMVFTETSQTSEVQNIISDAGLIPGAGLERVVWGAQDPAHAQLIERAAFYSVGPKLWGGPLPGSVVLARPHNLGGDLKYRVVVGPDGHFRLVESEPDPTVRFEVMESRDNDPVSSLSSATADTHE